MNKLMEYIQANLENYNYKFTNYKIYLHLNNEWTTKKGSKKHLKQIKM